MTKKVLTLTALFSIILLNVYSQKKSTKEFKLEASGEGSFATGSEFKQLTRAGYGLGLKGVFFLEENAAVTASLGATYYLKKGGSYDASGNELTPMATAIIPAKVGFRYYFADTYFIEPQVGYGVSIVGIFGDNSQSGGGFIFSPTIGFKNEGNDGIIGYLQYNLFNPKIGGINYNLSNISVGLGMNIW